MMIREENDEPLRSRQDSDESDGRAVREGQLLPALDRRETLERRDVHTVEGDARAELSGQHIAEIRQRIKSGAYNTVEVAGQVALRLLGSGELDQIDG